MKGEGERCLTSSQPVWLPPGEVTRECIVLQADGMAVSSYFSFFFMVAFKYRQCKKVIERIVSASRLCVTCFLFAL